MNQQEINKAWKDLPPAGSLELYVILNARALTKVRRDFDRKMVECIYRTL